MRWKYLFTVSLYLLFIQYDSLAKLASPKQIKRACTTVKLSMTSGPRQSKKGLTYSNVGYCTSIYIQLLIIQVPSIVIVFCL